MVASKKEKYDRTSTARSKRMYDSAKEAGGGAVNVRYKTADDLKQLDDLIEAGEGKDRSDVLRKLAKKRHEELFKTTT